MGEIWTAQKFRFKFVSWIQSVDETSPLPLRGNMMPGSGRVLGEDARYRENLAKTFFHWKYLNTFVIWMLVVKSESMIIFREKIIDADIYRESGREVWKYDSLAITGFSNEFFVIPRSPVVYFETSRERDFNSYNFFINIFFETF